jgi:hypothetical protein
VEGDQARAVLFPDVGHLAQHLGVVVHARGGLHAQGVELGGVREQRSALVVLQLGEAWDHAAAIAEHAHRAALPVALLGAVGGFQLAHQVDHVVLVVGQALEPGDKAGPRPAFQLVEHRRGVLLLGHGQSSPDTKARGGDDSPEAPPLHYPEGVWGAHPYRVWTAHGRARSMLATEVPMTRTTSLVKLRAPIGGQEIELQQVDLDAGGMSLLRTRIREKSRFTVFDIDPLTAEAWGQALLRWADTQPKS